jgi:hypothetical protein
MSAVAVNPETLGEVERDSTETGRGKSLSSQGCSLPIKAQRPRSKSKKDRQFLFFMNQYTGLP